MWEPEESIDVHENGRLLSTHTKAYMKNYDQVWFHEHAIANILSLKGIQSMFFMTCESASGSKVFVQKPNGVSVQLTICTDSLHYYDTNHIQITLVQTVKQTSEGYIQKHICNAKIAPSSSPKLVIPAPMT